MKNCIRVGEYISINTTRWEPRNTELVPVPDIDESVWKEELLDVVEDFLFLLLVQRCEFGGEWHNARGPARS